MRGVAPTLQLEQTYFASRRGRRIDGLIVCAGAKMFDRADLGLHGETNLRKSGHVRWDFDAWHFWLSALPSLI
jgi:hypothetical protein